MGKNMKKVKKSILGQHGSTTVKHQSTTVNASQSVGDIIADITRSIIESGSDLVWVRRWRHGWHHRLLACVARVRSGSGEIGSPDPVKNTRTLRFFRRLNDIVLTFYKSPYPLCFFFIFYFLSPKLRPKFSREQLSFLSRISAIDHLQSSIAASHATLTAVSGGRKIPKWLKMLHPFPWPDIRAWNCWKVCRIA